MLTKETVLYRHLVTLADGTRVLLRPMTPDDGPELAQLYTGLTLEDLGGMRHDVRDPKVIETWVDELDYDRVLPLLALVNQRVVGNATLHFHTETAQHRAEVRMFLARDFRRRGLGSRMLQALIDLARRRNIYMLEAQALVEQTHIIRAFQRLGFQAQCTLADYFLKPDGDMEDVVFMLMRLRGQDGDF